MKRKCAICSAIIPWRSDGVCHRCYKKYSDSDGNYPDWVIFMVKDTQRQDQCTLKEVDRLSMYGLVSDLDNDKDYD